MTTTEIFVANAPISYGAFELTVGIDPSVPDADALLDLIVEAGYTGVDLGPVGYLGLGQALRDRLESRGLGLAGGYLELPFSDHEALGRHFGELDQLLDVFEFAPDSHPLPKPTLADAGSPVRRENPRRAANDHSYGFDDDAWERFAAGLDRAVGRCRERGFEPTLHAEAGTNIEAPWEIDRALACSTIGLCLETGHELVGGGDSVETLERWSDRVNHVHLKDASQSVVDGIVTNNESVEAIWSNRAFPPLGEGDVAVHQIIETLLLADYTGWLVVEQDIMPGPHDPAQAQAHQVANRALLASHGL